MKKLTEYKSKQNIIDRIKNSTVTIDNKVVDSIKIGRNDKIVQRPAIITFHFIRFTDEDEMLNESYTISASFVITSYWIDKSWMQGYILFVLLVRLSVYGAMNHHNAHNDHIEVIDVDISIKKAIKAKIKSLLFK